MIGVAHGLHQVPENSPPLSDAGAVSALIGVFAPALLAKAPPSRIAPRAYFSTPQVQAFPNRQPLTQIAPRFVVEPTTIDPDFVVARSADIDPKIVINRSADIDPMIIATIPAAPKRR